MTEYGLGIHRYKGADKHEDNDGILHHYIETNVPFMNPPIKTLAIYNNTPIVGIFINESDSIVDVYVHFLEAIVRAFLLTEQIPHISIYYEDDFGVFVEFRSMKNLIDFYERLKSLGIRVPIGNIKLDAEVSYLPPPPPQPTTKDWGQSGRIRLETG